MSAKPVELKEPLIHKTVCTTAEERWTVVRGWKSVWRTLGFLIILTLVDGGLVYKAVWTLGVGLTWKGVHMSTWVGHVKSLLNQGDKRQQFEWRKFVNNIPSMERCLRTFTSISRFVCRLKNDEGCEDVNDQGKIRNAVAFMTNQICLCILYGQQFLDWRTPGCDSQCGTAAACEIFYFPNLLMQRTILYVESSMKKD